jgi:Lrp/AsnC family transcriptional regulator for asnA, asnC and gidA
VTPSRSPRESDDPLDQVDREIVRILQSNGRASNTEIARALDLSETTIRKRIARLVDEELISIVAVPTPKAAGATTSVIIGISVQLGELERISTRLVKHSEVRYLGHSTGRYDLIVEAFFKDVDHLAAFVANEIGADPAVRQVETSLILKVAKFSYEWEIT